VGHPDDKPLTIMPEVFRVPGPQRLVVDVSINGPERSEILQRIGKSSITDVAGMPDFITVLEMLNDFWVKVAVGVGEEADFHFDKGKPDRLNKIQDSKLNV